ncbi:NAD-dependent epimerase/dehydratase family protein [Sphingobacterium suaedae]|uniref:NAD-dependent epimerase/dehydratase family protein n=1 Tax=Sphingobacterium suaedae TaxID=1686402 RepID=A0ABW5KD32_9SPHI
MKFLILGCGWVGEFFARQMLAEGHEVFATTTQQQKYQRLMDGGIFAIRADFDYAVSRDHFPTDVDFVLNSIPASRRIESNVLDARLTQISALLTSVSYKKHIFLSSVGIYPDQDGVFTEAYPVDLAQNLAVAENAMLCLPETTVYRLGGLFGGNRIFAKYFENRICTIGRQTANFVHRDDVTALIRKGFLFPLKQKIYNIVTPEHPAKSEVVFASAAKYSFSLPAAFEDGQAFQKIVVGQRIADDLNYTFLFKSPLEF